MVAMTTAVPTALPCLILHGSMGQLQAVDRQLTSSLPAGTGPAEFGAVVPLVAWSRVAGFVPPARQQAAASVASAAPPSPSSGSTSVSTYGGNPTRAQAGWGPDDRAGPSGRPLIPPTARTGLAGGDSRPQARSAFARTGPMQETSPSPVMHKAQVGDRRPDVEPCSGGSTCRIPEAGCNVLGRTIFPAVTCRARARGVSV